MSQLQAEEGILLLPSWWLLSSLSWISIFATLVVLIVTWHIYLHVRLPGEVPMVWSWIPYLGSAIDMGKNPLEFIAKCIEKKKGNKAEEGIFGAVIAGKRYIFLVDPSDYDILFKQRKDLSFNVLTDRVSIDVFGVPAQYLHYGNTKAFHTLYSTHLLNDTNCNKLVGSMQLAMLECLGPMLSHGSGRPVTCPSGGDMIGFVREVVLTATFAAIWGADSDVATAKFRGVFCDFDAEAHRLLAGLPEWQYPKASKAKKEMLAILCNASPTPGNSGLVRGRAEFLLKNGVPPNAVAAFQLAITWASVAQTIPATFWLLFYILYTKGLKEIIVQEIMDAIQQDAAAGGGGGGDNEGSKKAADESTSSGPTAVVDASMLRPHHLAGMPKLQSCFSEAMRLSAASMGVRIATQRTTITQRNGTNYTVRKGDAVTGMFIAAHHRPDIYTDPYTYKWDRFLPQADGSPAAFYSNGKKLPQPMLGFGGGYTYCPGRKFAMSEAKFYVAYLLLNCNVSFVMDPPTATKTAVAAADDDAVPDIPPLDFERTGVGILYPMKPFPKIHVQAK